MFSMSILASVPQTAAHLRLLEPWLSLFSLDSSHTMNQLTLKQAAVLLVRFFGFYLLFFGTLDLLYAPGYWMRSTFSHPHSAAHSLLDSSYDVNLLTYYLREAAHFVIGLYLFRKPWKLAEILSKPLANRPEI
jgi:hypothetical protein